MPDLRQQPAVGLFAGVDSTPHANDAEAPQRRETALAGNLARGSDPQTSHLAAASISEALPNLQRWAVECVTATPGKTAMELARLHCPMDPRRIGRRLNECEALGTLRRGAKRPCDITKRQAETWWPVEGGAA